MTEAEALDLAAKAAGWRDWKNADPRTRELSGIRAHAKTLMENAALKAEVERLTAILSEMNDTDVVARTMAENERLRGWLKHQGGPLCMARYYKDAECTCGLFALLEEIDRD